MNPQYATDVTQEQWDILEPLLLKDKKRAGRPRRYPLPEIFNALFYIEKTGCQWRMLPRDLPPKETVWGHFRQFRDDGTLERIRLALNKKVRLKVGKSAKTCFRKRRPRF